MEHHHFILYTGLYILRAHYKQRMAPPEPHSASGQQIWQFNTKMKEKNNSSRLATLNMDTIIWDHIL